MEPWCIHISCFERVARSGSGRGSVRGLVGAMDAELSRPDWLATVQSGRKQVQSQVCMPGFSATPPSWVGSAVSNSVVYLAAERIHSNKQHAATLGFFFSRIKNSRPN